MQVTDARGMSAVEIAALMQKKAFDEDAFDREEIELFEEIMEGIYGEEI